MQPDDANTIVVTGTRLRNDWLFTPLPFTFARTERDDSWLGGAAAWAARFPGGASVSSTAFDPEDPLSDFKKKYSLEGIFEALGDGLASRRDELSSALGELSDEALNRAVRGLAYVTVTGAANSPSTSDLAARLLTQWRDGTSPYNSRDKAEFFAWDSAESRELFLGYSGDYHRYVTQLGIDQMVAAGNGLIRNGSSLKIANIRDFNEQDGLYGTRDGWQVADVLGSWTYPVSVRSQGSYLYFTGENAMSLGSFAADNRLQHGRVVNPSSGSFSTTYQKFEWRVPIPQHLLPKGR